MGTGLRTYRRSISPPGSNPFDVFCASSPGSAENRWCTCTGNWVSMSAQLLRERYWTSRRARRPACNWVARALDRTNQGAHPSGPRVVVAGRDLDESLGRIPRRHERKSRLAGIDTTQLLFHLESIPVVILSMLMHARVRNWQEVVRATRPITCGMPAGQGNPCRNDLTFLCAALGDHGACNSVAPTQLEQRVTGLQHGPQDQS
jgi:hypothetical protein